MITLILSILAIIFAGIALAKNSVTWNAVAVILLAVVVALPLAQGFM